MKNYIAILLWILCNSILLANNNNEQPKSGDYCTTFCVEYSNKNANFPSNANIESCLCFGPKSDSYLYDRCTNSWYTNSILSDTCLIANSNKIMYVGNVGTTTYNASGFSNGTSTLKTNTKQFTCSPGKHAIATADIKGRSTSPNYGNGTEITLFQANYSLIIQPLLVDCQYIEEDEVNYSYILYNDPVCIKATTGFPKEVYKWRYSYKTSKGVTKSGTFEPYDSSDNGATIYVKASDFMSEADFKDLLDSQNSITITPAGATGYNKPLSVKGINVTARQTAPKFKSISYNQPLCHDSNTESLTIQFDRSLLKGEKLYLQITNQENPAYQYEDSLVRESDNILVVNKSFFSGKWSLGITGRYKDTSNKEHDSYSESSSHSKTITITAPEAVNLSLTQIQHSPCYGDSTGSIEYNVIGGTGSKTCYLVDEANGAIIQEQEDVDGFGLFEGLPAGNYQLYATDQNGCFSNTAKQSITSPDSLSLQVHTTDATIHGKNNGILKATYSGGVAPYQLSYGNQTLSDESAATQLLLCDSLEACQDTLYLTDANGCQISVPFTITQPNPLVAYPRVSENIYCYGDANAAITIDSITGGISPYQVLWESDSCFLSNTSQIGNLSAGSYNLTVTDSAGAVYQQEVTITAPKALTLLAQVSTVSCNGDASGSIDMMVQGGTAPYTYMLDDSIQNHGLFSGLSNMAYYASVEDAHGCKVDSMFTILALDDSQTAPLASFLVAGEAPIHDDVHLINVMDPLQYDSIAWIYPQEDVLLYGKDERSIQLIFLKEGTYSLGMRAYKGTCYNTLYKNVRAVAQNNTIEGTPHAIIEELSISPSPNNGTFTAHIKLGKAENIDLCVYNASSGYVLHRENLTGKSFYTHPLSLSAPAGEYIFFITLPAWQKSRWIKFIIY